MPANKLAFIYADVDEVLYDFYWKSADWFTDLLLLVCFPLPQAELL